MAKVRVHVLRSHEAAGSRYQDYEVSYELPATILDLLRLIQQEQDPSLGFRSACGMGKCGSCAVAVNGEPVLSCQELVTQEEIWLEPLPNFPVIKDLIVDRDRYCNNLMPVLQQPPLFPLVPPRPADDPTWPECLECLVCDGVCPVMAQVPERFLGPALLAGTAGFQKSMLPTAWESAYFCLLCGECMTACPAGVKPNDEALDVRRQVTRKGRLPQSLQRLAQRITTAHNISGEENQARLLWSQQADLAPAASNPDTLYFVGCVSSLYPSMYGIPQGFATLMATCDQCFGLLGGEEWCCGYPLILNGMLEEAKELAIHNLQRMKQRGVKRLVMTCPSCYDTWHRRYPALTGEEIGIEVLHATQWLAELVDHGRIRFKELPWKVTYHDPCDLGRRNETFETPRQLLTSIPGVVLVEMKRNRDRALCCGGGGNLESFSPEVMTAIAQERIQEALDTGAEALITACPQCQRTLRAGARSLGVRLPVLDVVQALWRALPEQ